MPQPDQTSTPRDRLRRPLLALQALELGRPAHLTMDRYLRLLQRGELLSEPVVDAYLAVFQQVQYGQGGAAPRVEAAAEALAEEVATLSGRDADDLAWVRLQLNPPVVEDPAPAPAVAAPAPAPQPDAEAADLTAQIPRLVQPAPAPGERLAQGLALGRPPTRTLALGLGLLLIWSAVMLALGYRNADRIREAVGWVQRRGQPPPPAPMTQEQRLNNLRSDAGRSPDDKQKWLRYALVAQATHHYAAAVHAYQHVIRRWPDEAMALNNLAWLHLTATAAYVRDSREGMALARRAYAIDQAPYIADTLAEAQFQAGDIERAVELEQDALARAKSKQHRRVFQKNLKRYRAAQKNKAQGTGDREPGME